MCRGQGIKNDLAILYFEEAVKLSKGRGQTKPAIVLEGVGSKVLLLVPIT
jgi:hypothetical protein